MATEVKTDVEQARKDAELNAAENKVKELNSSRTGVGTRAFVGQTRGRNSLVITYENFDESQPDTLPKTLEEFAKVTGVTGEDKLVGYLITGYNDEQYKAASDPIAEYVNPTWDDDKKGQFRLVVRNMSKMLSLPIEDVAKRVLEQMGK